MVGFESQSLKKKEWLNAPQKHTPARIAHLLKRTKREISGLCHRAYVKYSNGIE
jgi:hypothetical protein